MDISDKRLSERIVDDEGRELFTRRAVIMALEKGKQTKDGVTPWGVFLTILVLVAVYFISGWLFQ